MGFLTLRCVVQEIQLLLTKDERAFPVDILLVSFYFILINWDGLYFWQLLKIIYMTIILFCFLVSFASLGFISIYLAGKLGVFNAKGRGQSVRLLAALLPLIAALAIALSRTCDYHHHWQGAHRTYILLFIKFITPFKKIFNFLSSDVLCGSILGLFITYTCYRQYYPPLDSEQADLPLNVMRSSAIGNYDAGSATEVPYKVV